MVGGELTEPEPVGAEAGAYMAEVLNLAGSPEAVPKRMTRPKSAQAAQTFGGVFAGKAVKNGVHAFAGGQFLNRSS